MENTKQMIEGKIGHCLPNEDFFIFPFCLACIVLHSQTGLQKAVCIIKGLSSKVENVSTFLRLRLKKFLKKPEKQVPVFT